MLTCNNIAYQTGVCLWKKNVTERQTLYNIDTCQHFCYSKCNLNMFKWMFLTLEPPPPTTHTASAIVCIKHKEEKTVFWCLIELWVPKHGYRRKPTICVCSSLGKFDFSRRIDLTKIPHQNKIFLPCTILSISFHNFT